MTADRGPAAATLSIRFGAFVDALPDAMVVVNQTGAIVLVNAHAERLFGYARDELIGQPVEILVPSRFARAHPRHRDRYVKSAQARPMGSNLELFGRRKDGVEFPVEVSLSPIETDAGTLIMSAVRDTSDRRRLEETVLHRIRSNSEVLSAMSHELRTPLNSIIGFADLMHSGRLGPIADDHREYLGDILTSARHLLKLINDVLDLSKVDTGKMEFSPEKIDLAGIVREVCEMLRSPATHKRIRITTDVDAALSSVTLDKVKLKQVLYNYLSNAIKFTAEGGAVALRVRPDTGRTFRIEVEDDGVGISPEDMRRLFIEFQQLGAGASKRHQGAGLGLALTRRIVEAQGGQVGATSEPGRGSCFFAVLPKTTIPS